MHFSDSMPFWFSGIARGDQGSTVHSDQLAKNEGGSMLDQEDDTPKKKKWLGGQEEEDHVS
jgi:hypothetical protein